jgi:hypothetical protein
VHSSAIENDRNSEKGNDEMGKFETTLTTETHILRLTKGISYHGHTLRCGKCYARTFWATATDRVTGEREHYMAQSDRTVARHTCAIED